MVEKFMLYKDVDYQKILDNMIKLKKEKQLSYQDLADKVGVSKSAMQRYFVGSIQNFPLKNVFALADALGVTVQELLDLG